MNIAVTSGKGGTGKTFVTLNLARTYPQKLTVLDCDVEEPNCDLFLQAKELKSEHFSILVPKLQEDLCTGCRLCAQVCEFNAIVMLAGKPLVMEDLCHSCGACSLLCPEKALIEVPHRIGMVSQKQKDDILLVEGRLDIGKALAVPLIRQVKKVGSDTKPQMMLIDSPPGTSCPMVWSIDGSDVVVLVAEPTAFGLHDLGLAVETVKEVGLPFGVIINKEGMGDNRVKEFCLKEEIPILGTIPYDKDLSRLLNEGKIAVDEIDSYRLLFEQLWKNILALAPHKEAVDEHLF
jgi:MinD superfamily P-loop ATPase